MNYAESNLFLFRNGEKVKINTLYFFKFIELAKNVFDEEVEKYNDKALTNYILRKTIEIFKKEIPSCNDAIELREYYNNEACNYYYILTNVYEDSLSTFISNHPEIGGNLKK